MLTYQTPIQPVALYSIVIIIIAFPDEISVVVTNNIRMSINIKPKKGKLS